MKKLSKKEITYLVLAVAVVFMGLKLSAAGAGQSNLFQNDGYSVTGAAIAAVGGFMIGTLFAKNRK
jgi:hypothetical protein